MYLFIYLFIYLFYLPYSAGSPRGAGASIFADLRNPLGAWSLGFWRKPGLRSKLCERDVPARAQHSTARLWTFRGFSRSFQASPDPSRPSRAFPGLSKPYDAFRSLSEPFRAFPLLSGAFREQTLSFALFFSLAAAYLGCRSMWVALSFMLCSSPSVPLPLLVLRTHLIFPRAERRVLI